MGATSARTTVGVMLAAAATTAAFAAPGAQAACTPAKNIQAIVDDSGSMSFTDDNRLRVQAMNLLINALDPGTLLGADEFGGQFFAGSGPPPADAVFPPEAVGANAASMKSALDAAINADNGGTDYNAAFAQSDADNPNADARIFLTDGGHDVGDYANGHLTHKVPTYVIGFSGAISAENGARLQQIDTDTGGHYYTLPDSSALQAVMDQVEAALDCQTAPVSYTDQLAQGKAAVHKLAIANNVKTARIALTWSSPLDTFTVSGIQIRRGRRVVAAARVRRLKVSKSTSSTFVLVKVSRLVRGTLAFKVRATKIGSGTPKVKLTTQVSRRR